MYRYPLIFVGGAAIGFFLGQALWSARPEKNKWPNSTDPENFAFSTAMGKDPWLALEEEWEDTLPSLPDHYEVCNVEEERRAKAEREACMASDIKATHYWNSLDAAEAQTISLLQMGNLQEISRFIACDARDLTWYEAHCQADLVQIRTEHIEDVLEFADARVLAEARWTREVNPAIGRFADIPNENSNVNVNSRSHFQVVASPLPNRSRSNLWKARSRLVSQSLRIGAPWSLEEEASEGRTLILLEEKIDGKVYLSGVPVTGIEKSKSQTLF